LHAEVGDDGVDDRDEGAGGAADLDPRATEEGDQEAGDDCGPDAGRGRHAGSDRERHRQRQREHADGDARGEVADEGCAAVAVQGVEEFGTKIEFHAVSAAYWFRTGREARAAPLPSVSRRAARIAETVTLGPRDAGR